MERILIVEDEKNIARLLESVLEKAGYNCTVRATGEGIIGEVLEKEHVDLIILDIGLPKIDGFEVCRSIKQESKFKNIPVLMLTSRAEEVDKIIGLELGADDYVTKPFNARELILRIKAILRRGKPIETKKDKLSAGILKVDIPAHKVTVGQKEIELTAMEFNLLVTLMERQGRVQTRDGLLSDVWGIHENILTRTVDAHIKRLREKLGKAGEMIETVIGVGYRFKEVETKD